MICTFFVHCNFQFDVEMEKKCKHELAEAASMDIELKKNPSKKVVKNAADKSILSSLLKLWSTIGAVMVIFLWVFMVELGTLGNRFVVQKYWVSSDFDSDSVPIERVYENNGYLMVTCNGGLNQMRTGVSTPCPCQHGQALKGDSSSMICDMVTIARFLNLTLIVPELDNTSFWHDTSTFQDIFDVDYFIKSLRDEVRILKELPPEEESRLESASLHSITPKLWSRMSFYYRKVRSPIFPPSRNSSTTEVLPEIRKRKVLRFNQSNTRLINNDLPDEIQKLRCRVNYNALRFTAPIEEIGRKIVRILRQKGPFLALHLRYEMDILSFTGCAQGLTHNETVELIKMRDFYPWWKTRSHPAKKRKGGGCPLTPGEAALALQSLGIDRNMQIYIASGDIYGGETRLAPLVEAYPNLVRKEKLLDPSDLKPFSGHWNQMAALDYTVSLESDIFVPTQAGNMALAVEGHRRYLGFRTTIMLNKKLLVSLIDQYKIGKLSWDDFSFIMKAAHADHMGKPKNRLKIPGQPQHEDSFYANPEECLPQMVKT